MNKITLTVQVDNQILTRQFSFDGAEDALASKWGDTVQDMLETLYDVPYNETEIPQFSGTLEKLNKISI